ncbi:hypothetical protein, partial [Alistipes putredinis]|uniref:hypothetical protein n=1 Tax=Alistipes putredinis TaxID=28117 RepID=UPI003AAC0688
NSTAHFSFLPVVERHRLHVVEREAPQIDRAVLSVAQFDTDTETKCKLLIICLLCCWVHLSLAPL